MCSRLARQLDLNDFNDRYSAVDCDAKIRTLSGLIRIFNGGDRVVDLSAIGGASKAGHMAVSFSKLLNDPDIDFVIVDQSVTGMFERKTRVGL